MRGASRGDDRSGEGAFTFANGDKYVGQFLENRFNGQGTFSWPDGSKYEGGWADGVKTGQGKKTWGPATMFAGDTYVGDFRKDKPNGTGHVYLLPTDDELCRGLSRTVYETADWVHLQNPTGSKYARGVARRSKRHGQGTQTDSTGQTYTVISKMMLSMGEGTLVFANSDTYVGFFYRWG